MSKRKYFLFRCVQTVVLLWLVLTFLFFLFRFMPGDYTSQMVHQGATSEQVEAFRNSWGLNDPLYVQYYRYIINFIQLDAGTSIVHRTPVVEHVKMSIFNSAILIAPALTVAYVLGTIFGTIMGSRRGSRLDKHGLVPFILFSSIPSFFLAIIAIIVFAGYFDWFPSFGMIDSSVRSQFSDAAWWRPYATRSFLWHYTLPFMVIVFRYLYLPTLLMRTNVINVIGEDFTHYHRMTGIPKWRRLFHVGKHSILPVLTLYPISLTRALGGMVLIETVFNWPGIGYTLVQAVFARNYPVVQFVFFVIAAFVILANFGVDVLYGMIDPRVSVEDAE